MPHSDSLLIRRALAGNQKAFQTLYEAHRPQIYGILAQRTADRDTVEDLVQATFIRAFGALHTFRGRAAFSTWLTRIALNVYRSHLRVQKTRQSWILETEDPESAARILREPASCGDPDWAMQQKERRELVRRGIQSLPSRYRQAMWLRYVKDWSYEEITHALQVPIGTVKTWLCRARRQLKGEFRKLGLQPT